MRWLAFAMALGLSAMFGTPAMADPRLDEVVYWPYVENHLFEFETRIGQEVGDGSFKNAQTLVNEFEYGFSDRLSLALVTKVERAPGEHQHLSDVGVEAIYYLGQIPRIGVDVGLYGELTKGAGGNPDSAETKLLLAKTEGRFQGLFNFIVERPFGGPPGTVFATYGYGASTTWRTVGNLRLGAEAFGDFGDDHGLLNRPQGAYLGPQVKWEGKPRFLPFELEVDAGWLAAVGADRREASSQLRVNIELEHRF